MTSTPNTENTKQKAIAEWEAKWDAVDRSWAGAASISLSPEGGFPTWPVHDIIEQPTLQDYWRPIRSGADNNPWILMAATKNICANEGWVS